MEVKKSSTCCVVNRLGCADPTALPATPPSKEVVSFMVRGAGIEVVSGAPIFANVESAVSNAVDALSVWALA